MELLAQQDAASPWLEQEVEVQNPHGIHARPAMMIAKAASAFKSDVAIRRNDTEVNAKSILALLTLVAEHGTRLTVRARGEDAREALAAVVPLVEHGPPDLQP